MQNRRYHFWIIAFFYRRMKIAEYYAYIAISLQSFWFLHWRFWFKRTSWFMSSQKKTWKTFQLKLSNRTKFNNEHVIKINRTAVEKWVHNTPSLRYTCAPCFIDVNLGAERWTWASPSFFQKGYIDAFRPLQTF